RDSAGAPGAEGHPEKNQDDQKSYPPAKRPPDGVASRALSLPGRAARFRNIKEWVRGFGSITTTGNPLTPTSPQMGRGSAPRLLRVPTGIVRLPAPAQNVSIATVPRPV